MNLPKTYFSTSLSGSARETELRIRNLFQVRKKHPPVWLMTLAFLSILLCGSLVSFQGQGMSPKSLKTAFSPSSGPRSYQSSVLISMETQYYDKHENYIEIPRLVMPDGAQPGGGLAGINQELDQLRGEYRDILNGMTAYYNPFNEIADPHYCLFYPSTTSRYLNLVFFQNSLYHYGDGTIRSWVFDLEEEQPVTADQALTLADTTQAKLSDGLEQMLQTDPQERHTVLRDCQIQGFRIREDQSVVFYLLAQVDYQETPGSDTYRWADRLYLWHQGTYTRYDCMSTLTGLYPLVPADETDQLSPALWNQWYFSGEAPGTRDLDDPTDGLDSISPLARSAYANVLTSLLEGHVSPDGIWPTYLADDPGMPNRFAVADVDGDGTCELVLLYAADTYAGYSGQILAYDEDTGTVRSELSEFPELIFYSNGIILAAWSHNQGWGGRFWPYHLYQYDPQSDTYLYAASVDGWDRNISEQNEGVTPFPTELDTSGTGIVYYVNAEGFDPSVPVDASVYARWLSSYIGGSSELTIPCLSLTTENIQLLRAGGAS